MSKKAEAIECSEEVRAKLQKMASSRTLEARSVQRARIVLGCLAGEKIIEIAKREGVTPETVIKWRKRFKLSGLDGLKDKKRSGKPRKYDKAFEKKVLEKLEENPPNGLARWDGNVLAKELKVSPDAVWRFLKKNGISLARRRTWCVSTDEYFAEKAADIVGLYLNPPERAIVVCVDEKPMIQALERKTGYVKVANQKVVRALQSTYKRHGTVNLFAALTATSGQIHGKVTREKKRADFLEFMDEIVEGLPEEKEIHVILDNHSIHKRLGFWLEGHKNVFFHYTPTSASWLNMVEIWFGIFTRKVLSGASFSSQEELTAKIYDYIESYKENAHPFIWRKREVKNGQIKNNIKNLCN